MTTGNDDLIRAFLADEARRATAAAPSLNQAVGRLAPRLEGRPSGASQRVIVLLAATLLLVAALGTAIAAGSGILRLPSEEPSVDLGIFEPVAGWIVYGHQGGIWGVDPAAPTNRVQLKSEAGTPLGWSADGTRLLIQRDEQLLLLHADESETLVTELPAESPSTPAAISPDGSRVVFVGYVETPEEGCRCALYAADVDGGPAEVLFEYQGVLWGLTFSPDGTQIAYVTGAGDHSHSVWVIDADGGNAHQILANETTMGAGHLLGLAWSPAGDRIAIGLRAVESGSTYTFAPDGSGFTRVPGIPGGRPYWSPDGSEIRIGEAAWHPGADVSKETR